MVATVSKTKTYIHSYSDLNTDTASNVLINQKQSVAHEKEHINITVTTACVSIKAMQQRQHIVNAIDETLHTNMFHFICS